MTNEVHREDPRIDFISDFIHSTLRCKPDKWIRLIAVDDNRNMLMDFLQNPDTMTVLIILNNTTGNMSVSMEWPAQIPNSRAFYFVKRRPEALPISNKLSYLLLYGDLSSSPIDQLYFFVDDVN